MKIEILSIFPELFTSFLSTSLVKKAQERALVQITLRNIRDHASPPHFQVDDTPYGGGPGMVMKIEPLANALKAAKSSSPSARVILLSAGGVLFSQVKAQGLSKENELIFICGRYEGVDERILELGVDDEISIGDYVTMGGELPAMIVIEATLRLLDEVIGNKESLQDESFSGNQNDKLLLESPHYTKPPEFNGLNVPEILLSGDHKKIREWRLSQSLIKTQKNRPDLLSK